MLSAINKHEYYMREALKEAQKAYNEDEIPVGAIIVCKEKIIARAHNLCEKLIDCTAHAEILAITSASNFLSAKYLKGCTIYVSLEPCVMCAGALFWSQIDEVVYGAKDPKRGFENVGGKMLHPKTKIIQSVLADECGALIKKYFETKRD